MAADGELIINTSRALEYVKCNSGVWRKAQADYPLLSITTDNVEAYRARVERAAASFEAKSLDFEAFEAEAQRAYIDFLAKLHQSGGSYPLKDTRRHSDDVLW